MAMFSAEQEGRIGHAADYDAIVRHVFRGWTGREHFDTFSMTTVVDTINEANVPIEAVDAMSGGGCATIYAGWTGEPKNTAAGPGSYQSGVGAHSMGSLSEFYVGPYDSEEGDEGDPDTMLDLSGLGITHYRQIAALVCMAVIRQPITEQVCIDLSLDFTGRNLPPASDGQRWVGSREESQPVFSTEQDTRKDEAAMTITADTITNPDTTQYRCMHGASHPRGAHHHFRHGNTVTWSSDLDWRDPDGRQVLIPGVYFRRTTLPQRGEGDNLEGAGQIIERMTPVPLGAIIRCRRAGEAGTYEGMRTITTARKGASGGYVTALTIPGNRGGWTTSLDRPLYDKFHELGLVQQVSEYEPRDYNNEHYRAWNFYCDNNEMWEILNENPSDDDVRSVLTGLGYKAETPPEPPIPVVMHQSVQDLRARFRELIVDGTDRLEYGQEFADRLIKEFGLEEVQMPAPRREFEFSVTFEHVVRSSHRITVEARSEEEASEMARNFAADADVSRVGVRMYGESEYDGDRDVTTTGWSSYDDDIDYSDDENVEHVTTTLHTIASN